MGLRLSVIVVKPAANDAETFVGMVFDDRADLSFELVVTLHACGPFLQKSGDPFSNWFSLLDHTYDGHSFVRWTRFFIMTAYLEWAKGGVDATIPNACFVLVWVVSEIPVQYRNSASEVPILSDMFYYDGFVMLRVVIARRRLIYKRL